MHSGLAQQYLNQRRLDLAIPEFQALVTLDPHNLDAQASLGVLLFFQRSKASRKRSNERCYSINSTVTVRINVS